MRVHVNADALHMHMYMYTCMPACMHACMCRWLDGRMDGLRGFRMSAGIKICSGRHVLAPHALGVEPGCLAVGPAEGLAVGPAKGTEFLELGQGQQNMRLCQLNA